MNFPPPPVHLPTCPPPHLPTSPPPHLPTTPQTLDGLGLGVISDQLKDLQLGELLDTPPPGVDEAIAIAKVGGCVRDGGAWGVCVGGGGRCMGAG